MIAGIDVGSTGIKVAVYSENGRRIGWAYKEFSINYAFGQRATVSPKTWVDALEACVGVIKHQVDLNEIRSIGISGANAMILTDETYSPVTDAIMQLDKRGTGVCPIIDEDLGIESIFQNSGNRNAAGFQWGATIKWLQLNDNEILHKARCIFNPVSYIIAVLTGSYCMDYTRAATTLLLSSRLKEWNDEYWEYFGLGNVRKPMLLQSYEVAGITTGRLAFPKGIRVSAGAVDTICATVGLAAGRTADALIVGSVGRYAMRVPEWDNHFLNTWNWNTSEKISMTPVNNAGTALKWVRSLLWQESELPSYDHLNDLAGKTVPGSEGLLFYPYLNGAGCPRWDNNVYGAFTHIQMQHSPGCFIRSVMEGVAYTFRENLDQLECAGLKHPTGVYLGGGGAKSNTWAQIISDVTGVELYIPEEVETETIGAALLGAKAIGLKLDADEWNHISKVIKPENEYRQLYDDNYKHFHKGYPLISQL